MAISNILPRKTMKNRTRLQSMMERHDYDQKAEKTKDGELVSSYQCSPESAAEEFEISKQLYYQNTGRSQPRHRDVIMYRIIQSFKPGEITPEDANRLGFELAMRFTKGQHQFVVSTHTDKSHIHTHIEFNSTNLGCDGKFQNIKNSYLVLRQLNDALCQEWGLSVIENPKPKSRQAGERAAIQYGVSGKERLRQAIERLLPDSRDFEDFLARMRSEGFEVRLGKYVAFRPPGQAYFVKTHRLGDSYTKEALMERTGGPRGQSGLAEQPRFTTGRPGKLLIDIQAKMQAGKGKGYERWARIFNLQEAAKTLNFLIDNNLTDYDQLAALAGSAGARFDEVSGRIKQLEGRMAEVAQLKTHIIQYSKTREVYAAYKKSRHKKEFRAEHAAEIALHEAAKQAFDALGGKPIPKVSQLSQEYGRLLEEKQALYEQYKTLRQDMIAYQTAKQNVDRILGTGLPEPEQTQKDAQTR